jgi:uncharacterized membrane protein
MSWEAYLRVAFEEIRLAGAGSPQVSRRLKSALLDLMSIAPPERLESIREQIRLLDAATSAEIAGADVETARTADGIGIGVAAGGDRRRRADATALEQPGATEEP